MVQKSTTNPNPNSNPDQEALLTFYCGDTMNKKRIS